MKAAMQWAKCRSIACQKQKAKLSHAILCRRLSSLIRFQCAKNSAENVLHFVVVVAATLADINTNRPDIKSHKFATK